MLIKTLRTSAGFCKKEEFHHIPLNRVCHGFAKGIVLVLGVLGVTVLSQFIGSSRLVN